MDKLYFISVFLYLLITVNAKFCDIDTDCNDEFTCKDGLCICDGVGKISNNEGTRCLDVSFGIGSECIEDVQCLSSVKGLAICTKDRLCGCKPGYRYLNNECVPIQGYKGYCSINTDCYDGINLNALKCENDECICNKGFYVRGDSDCRLSAKDTKKCLLDIDCESDAECCEFKYGPLGDCVSNLNPNNTCSGLKQPNASLFKTYENLNHFKKGVPLNRIDIPCNANTDCSKIDNSFCPAFRKKCTCKDGFIYNKYKNICVEGLGAQCADDKDCPIMHTYCNENKICSCQDYFIASNYFDKCLKPARGLNMSCGRDENCYSLGVYGTCNKNKCDCKFNSEYDEKLMLCKPTDNPINEGCVDNCETKPHSTCVNNKCECDDNYESINNKCLPDIGFECDEALQDCVIDKAECKNTKCECIEGYLKSDNRTCVKEINGNEDECVSNAQCEKYLGSGGICFEELGNCTCSPDYMRMIINEKDSCILIRQFGEQCTSNAHCKTILQSDHVVCRNSKCECDYDFHLIEDESGKRCENGSSIILVSNLLIWTFIGILLTFNIQ